MLYDIEDTPVIDANTGQRLNNVRRVDVDHRRIELTINGQPEWQDCVDVQVKRGWLGGVKEFRVYGRQG